MPLYRSYFVTKEGSIAAWHSFHKDDDEEARGHVRATAHTPEELRALCVRVLKSAREEADPSFKRSLASYALSLAEEAEALEWRIGRARVNSETVQ